MKYQPISLNRISNLNPSLTQIIKNWGLLGTLLLFVWSCENKAPSSQKKTPPHKGQEVIDQAIIAHGQHLFENATLSFSYSEIGNTVQGDRMPNPMLIQDPLKTAPR